MRAGGLELPQKSRSSRPSSTTSASAPAPPPSPASPRFPPAPLTARPPPGFGAAMGGRGVGRGREEAELAASDSQARVSGRARVWDPRAVNGR